MCVMDSAEKGNAGEAVFPTATVGGRRNAEQERDVCGMLDGAK